MSIEVVSARVDSLTKDVQRVEGTVVSIDKKVDDIGQSMLMLARLEERHTSVTEQLALGSKVMSNMEVRLALVEQKMPGLTEMRSWVIGGVLSGAGMIGLGILKLVFIK